MNFLLSLVFFACSAEALKCWSGVPENDEIWNRVFYGRKENMVAVRCPSGTKHCKIEQTISRKGIRTTVHGCDTERQCVHETRHTNLHCCKDNLCNSSKSENLASIIRLKRSAVLGEQTEKQQLRKLHYRILGKALAQALG